MIACFVSVVIVGALTTMGPQVKNLLSGVLAGL